MRHWLISELLSRSFLPYYVGTHTCHPATEQFKPRLTLRPPDDYNCLVMVEDNGKEDEPKLEFTPEGETLGYISLDQARVLALQHARDNPEFYGRYADRELV